MKLYDHQKKAVDFLIRNNGCGALYHSPGCGKTLTALETFRKMREADRSLKLFVVCPLSLVNAAWGSDIQKFTEFTYKTYKEFDHKTIPDILIINYEYLITDRVFREVRSFLAMHRFFIGVVDESSRMKSAASKTTRLLLELAPLFRHRIIASGTPCPNSEMELWGQLNFVRPYMMHRSFFAFRNTYFHLQRGNKVYSMPNGVTVTKAMMSEIFQQGWKYAITPANRKRLLDHICGAVNWVKKEEVLDLPEKTDVIRDVFLSPAEQKAYRQMKMTLVAEIGGSVVAAPVALSKLMKLRQATSGFMYSTDVRGGAVTLPVVATPSKFKVLEEVMEEIGPKPVIIWCQFHEEIERLAKHFGNKAVTLYAGTKDRDESITAFQQGRAQYLVAHPRSAAHGLTFTNCDTMVFYSMDYSFEAYEQARDRIHRIGQNNTCLYIHLICPQTIDVDLLDVVTKKRKLQDVVHGYIKGSKIHGRTNNPQDNLRDETEGAMPAVDQDPLSESICI